MAEEEDMPHHAGAEGSRGSVRGIAAAAGGGLTVIPFLPARGGIRAHDPDADPPVPLSWHDEESETPAGKCAPARSPA